MTTPEQPRRELQITTDVENKNAIRDIMRGAAPVLREWASRYPDNI